MLNGSDVVIVQNLIARVRGVFVAMTQVYDPQTAHAVGVFQAQQGLPVTGVVDAGTAFDIIKFLSDDHYVDDGRPAQALGYMYKVHIPVHRNRSSCAPPCDGAHGWQASRAMPRCTQATARRCCPSACAHTAGTTPTPHPGPTSTTPATDSTCSAATATRPPA